MLRIGFAEKFFTLWDVSPKMHGDLEGTYCSYYQNLAFKLEDAQAKAKAMGATDLEPDYSLKGSSSFWRDYEPGEYIPETFEDWQFTYGRNKREDVRECTDVDYLKWYYSDDGERNQYILERILELDSNMVVYRKRLMTLGAKEYAQERFKMEKMLKKEGYAEVEIQSNVRHPYKDIRTNVGEFEMGEEIELKWMSYNGYDYALPVNPKTGKGMRIKWKKARLYCSGKSPMDVWVVDKIELIKN